MPRPVIKASILTLMAKISMLKKERVIFALVSLNKLSKILVPRNNKTLPKTIWLARLKISIISKPKILPSKGKIKWNIATRNGKTNNVFFWLQLDARLKDKEKVSIDKDMPIKIMDTRLCTLIT